MFKGYSLPGVRSYRLCTFRVKAFRLLFLPIILSRLPSLSLLWLLRLREAITLHSLHYSPFACRCVHSKFLRHYLKKALLDTMLVLREFSRSLKISAEILSQT